MVPIQISKLRLSSQPWREIVCLCNSSICKLYNLKISGGGRYINFFFFFWGGGGGGGGV